MGYKEKTHSKWLTERQEINNKLLRFTSEPTPSVGGPTGICPGASATQHFHGDLGKGINNDGIEFFCSLI